MKYGILNRHKIRALWEACGHDADVMASTIDERLNLKEDDSKALTPDNFSFREIAEGLGGDTSPGSGQPIFQEAVTAAQFSTIVGTLLSKKVMDAYNGVTKILDQLVTSFTSTQETDTVPGGYISGDLKPVGEGAEYPHTADISEKYVQIGHGKRGLILDVTDEAVRFDRTGIIMREAGKLGERMARDRESRGLKVIQDLTGYKGWKPSGTADDLYQNAQGAGDAHAYDNYVTDVLSDYTDVEALWLLLKLMKDDIGEPMAVDPKILLVPVTLDITATRIIRNNVLPGGTNNEMNPISNRFAVLSSPYLDDNSTTAWYLGDFKQQFVEKVVIPPQVMSRRYGDNNEDAWRRDVVASYKVRHDTLIGAVDYRFVGMSAGTG